MADNPPLSGSVQLRGIGKSFDGHAVIQPLDLEIAAGQFVVFVGPSGCGKSTLLRLIAGLETPDAGQLLIDGRDVTTVHPADRGIAMVFQSYALYPHMSVADNMGFGLKMRGMPREQIATRVRSAAEKLQLTHLLERKPKALSGGQRQRVAIGRAIVRDPKVFLFDEPLSNLDASLRGQMRVEIARLHAQVGATMVYVTHDQVEAMTLADVIVVLQGGRIEQVGAPMTLYQRPANRFVAGFIGAPRMNFLPLLQGVRAQLSGVAEARLARADTLGVRPEHLRLGAGEDAALRLSGQLLLVERLGGETVLHVQLAGLAEPLVARLNGDVALTPGQMLALHAPHQDLHLFDTAGIALDAAGPAP